jgi:hypothetical protein
VTGLEVAAVLTAYVRRIGEDFDARLPARVYGLDAGDTRALERVLEMARERGIDVEGLALAVKEGAS